MIPVTGATIKNVAKGILGVAFFQFITAGAVFMLAGVPLPGLCAWFIFVK
jgi:predicted PurR-regulated permease PerM